MRTKNFLIFLFCVVVTSLLLIVFGHEKPTTIQNIVSTTHQQIRNFQNTLKEVGSKSFVADEKYLSLVGLIENPRLYPKDVWLNTSLPVFVTYVLSGQESQGVGLVNNVGHLFPNHTILIYDLGLATYELRTLLNYCNSSRCQVIPFDLNNFPSHVQEENLHAYRPLVIQDALQRVGAVFFLENNKRLLAPNVIVKLFHEVVNGSGVLAWPYPSKNAVTSFTQKKMFEYFRTDADSFLFVQMVSAEQLLLVNTAAVHKDIMWPWVQCALTQDCIYPIGAKSVGCRFDKKPQYRYSGCHSYDTSALNIALALKFKLDSTRYTYSGERSLFRSVSLDKARAMLRGLEQNATTEGRTQLIDSITGL